MPEPHQLLWVPRNASEEEIRIAYAHERARLIAENATPEQLQSLTSALVELTDMTGQSTSRDATGHTDAPAALATSTPSLPVAMQLDQAPDPQRACPHCGMPNPIMATVCRSCGGQISRPCPSCGTPVLLGQPVCARCQTVIAEYDQRRFAEAAVTIQQVEQQRQALDVRAPVVAEEYRRYVWQSTVFWVVMFGLFILLCALVMIVYNLSTSRG